MVRAKSQLSLREVNEDEVRTPLGSGWRKVSILCSVNFVSDILFK